MSDTSRVITLGLDYSGFSGGLSEINSRMQVLSSEFNRASAEAEAFGTESDQQRLRVERLTQQINLQAQRVEICRQRYEQATESGGMSEQQLNRLRTQYNNAQAQLTRYNAELESYTTVSEEAEEVNASFGDTIRGLADTLGLQASPAVEALASKFDGMSAECGTAITVIGGLAGALFECTKSAAAFADDLLTLSATTGVTTEELQKMQYASNLLDVDVELMTGSMTKLTNNMQSARDGSNALNKTFDTLHVKVSDTGGQLRDANEVFYECIDALGKIKNETERDAYAMDIFGKSARDLNPLIEAGSARLKELGIQAEDLGMVMSEEELGKLGQFNDAFEEMGKKAENLKNRLGLILLPILTGLFEAIAKIPQPVLATLVVLASTIATILLIVKAIKSMTDTFNGIKKFFSGMSFEAKSTTAIIIGVVLALVMLAVAISAITGKSQELQNTFNSMGNAVSNIGGNVQQAQQKYQQSANVTGYHARGTDNFQGGQTWVGEDGPELVTLPRGTRIQSSQDSSRSEVNNFNITIDAKNIREFNDIVNLCKREQQARRRL